MDHNTEVSHLGRVERSEYVAFLADHPDVEDVPVVAPPTPLGISGNTIASPGGLASTFHLEQGRVIAQAIYRRASAPEYRILKEAIRVGLDERAPHFKPRRT